MESDASPVDGSVAVKSMPSLDVWMYFFPLL